MKLFPRKCGECRERAVSPVTLPAYTADLEHDGRTYQVTLTDLPALQCSRCHTIILDDAADEALSDALRSAAGLLFPSEIRQGRETLGLTQKELAGFLQISDSTLSRWETGAQIQQRCMDMFLRAFFAVPEVRGFLGAMEPVSTGQSKQKCSAGMEMTKTVIKFRRACAGLD